jgi:hypothetical protein
VAKRSPILGYNHNVRYRGLVFHVQTEDSGVLSPHLFTHLFYGGTIISTRKLVYDAGAAEDAIKALMQAQHKAVMKDLKNGAFDEKIDQYLGGTPGLEPRAGGTTRVPRASTPEVTPTVKQERAETDVDTAPTLAVPAVESAPVMARAKSDDALTTPVELALEADEPSAPIELPRKEPEAAPQKSRTKTAERGSKGSVRFNPPPPPPSDDLEPPTITDDRAALAAAVKQANTSAQPPVSRTVTPAPGFGVKFRAATPPPIPSRAAPPPIPTQPSLYDSSPEIEISIGEESSRNRVPRDTQVDEVEDSDGIPKPRPRPPSHGAATLPPARKPSRPAITPPTVMARPVASAEDRSGAVEIYAPAPSSADPPPGERAERASQYSINRQRSADVPMREKTGRSAAIPSGLGRPRSESSAGKPGTRPPTPSAASQIVGGGVPQPIHPPDSGARNPHVTAPISSRNATSGSGVVMSRPAVIVGAPTKGSAPQTQPRIRKAREDEGRGFGQGLISEKSLDEVILAYLSEDGDDK